VDPEGRPSWNVGPTKALPAVVESEGHRVLDLFRWGLVPHWAKAKDTKTGYKMINARAETVASKPAYRAALARRRCLVVVDGFYEWTVVDPNKPKQKVPFYFRRADGRAAAFAGLYELWWDKSRSEEPDPDSYLQTCVIVTTEAGPDMAPIHDRMPVIIEEENWEQWLDPDLHDTAVVTGLLVPSPAHTLVRHAVSTDVNSPRNDGPQIIVPVVEPAVELR
jgi:putative SOS response-associated peptidase YedK